MTTPPTFSLSKDEDWETPINLFAKFCLEKKVTPILDVCAGKGNSKCVKAFTKKENGLIQQWDVDFFFNPPYNNVKEWVDKAYYEHRKHNVTGVGLIFAKTDTKMWHRCIEGIAEVYFIEGRVKFEKKGVVPKYCRKCKVMRIQEDPICPDCLRMMNTNSAPYPSCWVVWRKK
jgi:phage N-6-adenine-methyltransferase